MRYKRETMGINSVVGLNIYFVRNMQSLGSPFQSPQLKPMDNSQMLVDSLELVDPTSWMCSFQHVSLPEIELQKPVHMPRELSPLPNDWSFPSQKDLMSPARDSSQNATLTFTVDGDGRASIENTLDSSNFLGPNDSIPPYTGHPFKFSEWNLSSNVLGISSSPRRMDNEEELTQVSLSPAAPLSSSPPPEIVETTNTPMEVSQPNVTQSPAKKRKRNSEDSAANTRVNLKCIETSDIASDPSHELMHLETNEYAGLRSKAQVEKIMFRGILRARKAFEEVCANRRMTEDSQDPNGLEPVLREPEGRPWNGKNSRCEAIKELSTAGLSKSVRGFLRCNKLCDQTFETFEDLAYHIDEQHGASARPYECPLPTCPWSIIGFSHFSECARHIASSHGERKFICELCELENKFKSFTRTDALRRHISRTHHVNSVKRVKKQKIDFHNKVANRI